MRIQIIKVGKPSIPSVPDLVANYRKRSSAWIETLVTVTRKNQQDLALLKSASPSSKWIILDETGELCSSLGLSQIIEDAKNSPALNEIYFVIGGPYGVPKEYLERAHLRLSLGRLTLPSDLAWLVLSEQIYRALSILSGSPYHHGNP